MISVVSYARLISGLHRTYLGPQSRAADYGYRAVRLLTPFAADHDVTSYVLVSQFQVGKDPLATSSQ
jgi:hypothetical protein